MWLIMPLLVLISYLNTVTGAGYLFPLYVLVSLAVPIIFKQYRYILLYFLLALVFFITMNDLRSDSFFLEEKIFSVRDEICHSYSELKEDLYKRRLEIIDSKLSESGDLGFTVYGSDGSLQRWSGNADFEDNEVYSIYPKLTIKDNDVSLRFKVYERDRIYYVRMHLTNVYSTESTVSKWIRGIQDKYDMGIMMYFTPGQFYVYDEPVLYNELKDVESLYLKSTDSLYSMMDDGIVLKIERKGLGSYLDEIMMRFFVLTCVLSVLISVVKYNGTKRLFLAAFSIVF